MNFVQSVATLIGFSFISIRRLLHHFCGSPLFPSNSLLLRYAASTAILAIKHQLLIYYSIWWRCCLHILRWFWIKMSFQLLFKGVVCLSKVISIKARMWKQFISSGLAFIYGISSNQTPLLCTYRAQNNDYCNLFSLFSGHLSFVYICCPCLFIASSQHLQQCSVGVNFSSFSTCYTFIIQMDIWTKKNDYLNWCALKWKANYSLICEVGF